MSALTRIFNNQIYNATIVASQKIAPGSITGSLFASNVTVPGDLLIAGNLFVLGSSTTTTIASTNTYVNDPMVLLNNGFSGTNTRDIGFVLNRGTDQNQAMIWSEVFDEFRLVATSETGVYGNLTATGLARLSIGSLNVPGQANIGVLSIAGAITGASLNVTGNVVAQAGTFNSMRVNGNDTVTGFLNVTGNILASQGRLNYLDVNGNVDLGLAGAVSGSWINVVGNITQASSGGAVYFNTAGNVLAQAATFNALTVNGNETISGFINAAGNISTPQLNAGQINTTGNILATAGTFNSMRVNGNDTVTGFLNVTGNILGATGTLSVLGVSNTLWANSSAVTTTQGTGALIIPNGGISVAGAANIAGTITTAGAAQLNNTLTVGGIQSISNTTNATEATGSTGALQIKGGVSIAKDAYIGGNLYVSNIFGTSYQILTVQDPLVYFNSANTFPYNYDVGFYSNFIGPNPVNNTGNVFQHTGVVRDNADNTWKFFSNVRTAPGGSSVSFDADTIYDPVLAGNLTLTYTQAATSTTTGALQVAGGAGIAGAVVAGQLNSTGNVLAQAATFNALTVNGGITTSGFFNTSGNISAAVVRAGQINTTGNVLASTVLAQLVTADDATFGNVASGFIGNTGTAYIGASVNLSGNVIAAQGSFGSINSTGYINTSGNISTPQLNAGQINTTGNVLASTIRGSFLTASTVAVGNISAVTIGNSGATVTGTIATFSGNVIGGLAQFAAINNTPIGNATASTGSFTTLRASQGIWANSTTASTTTTTGAIVVAGGVGLAGNIRAGGGAVFNSSQTADPFQVRGVAATTLIYADTAFGAVIIGGSNTATPLGSTLKVNGTDSMLLPIGSTGQRPSLSGNVDLQGMLRYNTTINNLEFYDGAQWNTPGGVFTVISDRQFAGNVGSFGNVDGINTSFTIQSPSTTAGTIVSINGVIQIPVLAYAISGTTLTFTEPPAPEDVIDVRVLSTTVTVGSLSSGNGTNQIFTEDNGVEIWTGVGTTVKRIEINQAGDVNLLDSNKLTYTQTGVNITANNTPYVIATYSQTAYTTAKFLVSAKKDTTNFQSMEALVTTDGAGNAYIATYAIVDNGTDMGALSANVLGGNVQVYWTTTTNITNANVKAFGTYIV